MGGLREIPGFLGTGGNLLVDLTLVIEILFYISLCLGVTAQLRKQYKWHDRFQIPVVVLNLFFIAFVMIPTLIAIISSGVGNMPGLVLAHASFGVLAQGVAVYCLLAGLKILPRKIGVLRWFMWAAFVLWTITLLLGIMLYIDFYTGGDSSGEAVTEHAAELASEHAAEVAVAPTVAPIETVAEHAEEPVITEPTEAPVEPVEEHAEAPVELVEEHAAEPVEVAAEPTATPEPPPPTPTPAPVRAGLLTVSDDQVHGDKATLALTGVAAPPDGSVYEAWLEGETQTPFSLGKLTLQGDAINHTFTDPAGRNLLALFNRAFISVEPTNDNDPAPSGVNAFEGEVSAAALEPIRLVVAAALDTPDGDGYALNALNQVLKIEPEVGFQKDYSIAENDLAALKIQAEGILNILEGQDAPNFGDRDGSGDVYNPGDGYGLLGFGAGYLPAIATQAAAAAQVEGASPETVLQAEQAQAAAANAISLAEQIRDLELQILQAGDTASAADLVNQVVALTQSLTDADGVDLANPGQGGMRTLYTLGQLMASIELFPVAGEITAPAAAPTPELIDEHAGDTVSEHDGN
ncbi:MAG: hypothetical protein DPW09_42340 [Anaerolineae bacterium]|nr:hypothetical protein [Anaerolineales bacterium]MCQ3980103.1 hypothetical protein [Anaerolineae bacterium]